MERAKGVMPSVMRLDDVRQSHGTLTVIRLVKLVGKCLEDPVDHGHVVATDSFM